MKEYFYKNTFAKKFTVLALAGVLGFALSACDNSSSASNNELPAEVYDLAELDTYECNDEITGQSLAKNKRQDQTEFLFEQNIQQLIQEKYIGYKSRKFKNSRLLKSGNFLWRNQGQSRWRSL